MARQDLRNGEVDPGDGCLRREKLGPEVLPGRLGEVGRIACAGFGAQLLVKEDADFLLLKVNGRHDDVARRLAGQLYDPLAQIRIHDLDAALLQEGVQVAFFRQHRLALDHPRYLVLL